MSPTGRVPNSENIGLEGLDIKTGLKGEIIVDKYSKTNVANIYAIGDVTNRVQLTPVAIVEATAFVETVYKSNPKDASVSTTGLAIAGPCSSRIRRISRRSARPNSEGWRN